MKADLDIFGQWTDGELERLLPAFRDGSAGMTVDQFFARYFDYRLIQVSMQREHGIDGDEVEILRAEAKHLGEREADLARICHLHRSTGISQRPSSQGGKMENPGEDYVTPGQVAALRLRVRWLRALSVALACVAAFSAFLVTSNVIRESVGQIAPKPRMTDEEADRKVAEALKNETREDTIRKGGGVGAAESENGRAGTWLKLLIGGDSIIPLVTTIGMLAVILLGYEMHYRWVRLKKLVKDRERGEIVTCLLATLLVACALSIVSWITVKMVMEFKEGVSKLSKFRTDMTGYDLKYGEIISDRTLDSMVIELIFGLVLGAWSLRAWHRSNNERDKMSILGKYPECHDELQSCRKKLWEIRGKIAKHERLMSGLKGLKDHYVLFHVALSRDLLSKMEARAAKEEAEARIRGMQEAAKGMMNTLHPVLAEIRRQVGEAKVSFESLARSKPLSEINAFGDKLEDLFKEPSGEQG